MCNIPTLVKLDCTNTILLECDAMSHSIGVVLMNEEKLLAFTHKYLCDWNLGKTLYKKEIWTSFMKLKIDAPILME